MNLKNLEMTNSNKSSPYVVGRPGEIASPGCFACAKKPMNAGGQMADFCTFPECTGGDCSLDAYKACDKCSLKPRQAFWPMRLISLDEAREMFPTSKT